MRGHIQLWRDAFVGSSTSACRYDVQQRLMPNLCNVRLVVTGRQADVRKFVDAVRERVPREHRRKRAILSFSTLAPVKVTRGTRNRAVKAPAGPYDAWREGPAEVRRGLFSVTYGFQTALSPPADWLFTASATFPSLVFVLGWLEPNLDMTGSVIAGLGSTRSYELGRRRKGAIYRKHQRRWAKWVEQGEVSEDNDIELFSDWEADDEVMDVLVARWAKVVQNRVRRAM